MGQQEGQFCDPQEKGNHYNQHIFSVGGTGGDPKESVAALVSLSLGDRLLLGVLDLEFIKQCSEENYTHNKGGPEIYVEIPLNFH